MDITPQLPCGHEYCNSCMAQLREKRHLSLPPPILGKRALMGMGTDLPKPPTPTPTLTPTMGTTTAADPATDPAAATEAAETTPAVEVAATMVN